MGEIASDERLHVAVGRLRAGRHRRWLGGRRAAPGSPARFPTSLRLTDSEPDGSEDEQDGAGEATTTRQYCGRWVKAAGPGEQASGGAYEDGGQGGDREPEAADGQGGQRTAFRRSSLLMNPSLGLLRAVDLRPSTWAYGCSSVAVMMGK